ncbi:septum formation family protein [Yinghuangia sp. YIM S10712]|uniref:septum formation family protein n=1 Tax=Yinghuangia sp. YIM S10712 TaxID=3436930 RepID=UPI003F5365A3
MRSPRSPRKSALRVTAAAASGIFAIALLTGCNGDDKDGKPGGIDIGDIPKMSIPPMPTMPSLDIPDLDLDSSGSPGATSTRPAGGATMPGQVESVDLKAGDCIDTSSSGQISKKSCSGPHDAQVAGVSTISDSLDPRSSAFENANDAACDQMGSVIIDRQDSPSDLTVTWYAPTPESWEDGDRTLQCLIVRRDKTELTEKLI